jgi:thiazole synthase
MEMGFDGVLLNTAVAKAQHPPKMAAAFANAIDSGREAFNAGLMLKKQTASPSTPTIGQPFWHQSKHN